MNISLQDRPLLIQGQYVDRVDKHTLYYNPLGYGGVTVVGSKSQRLLSLCDGNHTVNQLLRLDADVTLCGIQTLADREVVNISENFTREIHEKSRKKASLSCWLHLTNSCNLACTYCYIHKTPGTMPLETGKTAIDKMLETCRNHGIPNMNIKFSGGEPLLRFDLLKELVDYSQRKRGEINITYIVLTNGVLVTPLVAEYLGEHKIGVGVSLDGIGNVNDICRHDRHGRGSFSGVAKGLNTLLDSGVKPSTMTTISLSNYPSLLPLTQFLLEGGYHFQFSLERNCETGFPETASHSKELIQSLHECYDYIESNLPEKDFLGLHAFGDVGFRQPARISCGAGSSYLAIGHDGKLGVCQMGLAKPFSSIDANQDLLSNLRNANHEMSTNVASNYPQCNCCAWRKSCAGGCPLQAKATHGYFNGPSPYCSVYKEILPRILRIRGVQLIRNSERNTPA